MPPIHWQERKSEIDRAREREGDGHRYTPTSHTQE